MKKICVLSTSRADYGHLYWVMKDIEASDKLQLQIIHPENHHNNQEIYQKFIKNGTAQHLDTDPIHSIDDFGGFYKDCLNNLRTLRADIVVCLGDRWEMLAAATAALLLNIPIVHIHGGETTTGSFDDNIRNAITVMADIHFTAHRTYAKKVCDMTGTDGLDLLDKNYPSNLKIVNERVFNVGGPGIDWLTRAKLKTKAELQQSLNEVIK